MKLEVSAVWYPGAWRSGRSHYNSSRDWFRKQWTKIYHVYLLYTYRGKMGPNPKRNRVSCTAQA